LAFPSGFFLRHNRNGRRKPFFKRKWDSGWFLLLIIDHYCKELVYNLRLYSIYILAYRRFLAVKHIWTIVAMATWVFAGTTVYADGLDTVLSFTPNFLSVEVRENKQNKPQEASINSGLDLQFRTELLQFDVDYKVKVQLKGETHDAAVSRQAAASLYSNSLNRLLGLNADIRAGSTIKQGDGGYAHSVTPGFSKTFSDLATLKVQYKYSLDQANAKAPEQEKSGYRMALSGESQGGRLTWKGNLGSTDVFGGASQLQSTELMEFESHYLLAPDIRLELSGAPDWPGRHPSDTRWHSK
jgi:hypothetical protein